MVKNADVRPNAVVQKIVFNLRLGDKKFKDLVMDYSKTSVSNSKINVKMDLLFGCFIFYLYLCDVNQ